MTIATSNVNREEKQDSDKIAYWVLWSGKCNDINLHSFESTASKASDDDAKEEMFTGESAA